MTLKTTFIPSHIQQPGVRCLRPDRYQITAALVSLVADLFRSISPPLRSWWLMFKQIVIPSKLQDTSQGLDMEGRRLHLDGEYGLVGIVLSPDLTTTLGGDPLLPRAQTH